MERVLQSQILENEKEEIVKKLAALVLIVAVLAGCAAPTPVVVEKEVPIEVEVIKEVVVEKEVPVEVEKEVVVDRPVVQTVVVETEKIIEKQVVETVVVEVEKVVMATPEPTKAPEPVTIRMHHWGTPA
jgi:hypothetical protein